MGLEFKSGFAQSIESYLEYRDGMHYGGGGERMYLLSFDQYCAEHFPGENSLTKEAVRSWFSSEIARGHRALENKATTIRMFARYLGPSSYILPMNFVPKVPQYVPYIMTDDELRALTPKNFRGSALMICATDSHPPYSRDGLTEEKISM